ncbi:hypothetical protein P8452_35791 [Trifolium repens]|nr:hypothetical protein P8452_35791 [Trifolium repens]
MEDIAQGLTKDANPAHEFDLNKSAEENEDQTNVVEYSLLFNLSGFSNIDLNKFPEDDYENDNYEEKEKKKLLNTLRQTCFVETTTRPTKQQFLHTLNSIDTNTQSTVPIDVSYILHHLQE